MPNTKVLIVEDDPVFAIDIERMLDELGYSMAGPAEHANKALDIVSSNSIDIALVDIQIKGRINGIELAAELVKLGIPVIFLTALADDQAFNAARQASTSGYLVKPVSKYTLQSALEAAMIQSGSPALTSAAFKMMEENKMLSDTFFIKSVDRYVKVRNSEILMVEADGNYSVIYTKEKKFAVKVSLKEMKLRLSRLLFVQVHRSYLVQLTKIESIDATRLEIRIHNRPIPVGKRYKQALMERLNKF
jgi:DNA-binding LytR/AlgR family response regulator